MTGQRNEEPSEEVREDPLDRALSRQDGQVHLDLSALNEQEKQALIVRHQEGQIDIMKHANTLKVDVAALGAVLDKVGDAVADVDASGNAITITHTEDSAVGRTEIIVGNTGRAESGRLSRSQTGDRDWTPYYIVGAVVAIIAVTLILVAALT